MFKQFYLGMAAQAFLTAAMSLLGFVVAPGAQVVGCVVFLALAAVVNFRDARAQRSVAS
jgi:hypothetical protein